MNSGVYRIVNTLDGKVYVGSAVNISNRRWIHLSMLRRGRHRNSHLQNAWDKYGEECFIFETIEMCEPERLIEVEQRWINHYDSASRYNILTKAQSSLGFKHSEEAIDKMSRRVFSEETRRHMSEAGAGKPRPWRLGLKHSEETRKKMSLSRRLRPPHSDATRAKMRVSATRAWEHRHSVMRST